MCSNMIGWVHGLAAEWDAYVADSCRGRPMGELAGKGARIDRTKAGSLRLATTTTRMQLWAHFTLPPSRSRNIAIPILDLLHLA